MGSIFKLTALAGVAAGAYAAVKKFAPNILPDKNEAEDMAKNAINSVKLTFPTDEKYSNGTALTPPMGWSSWNTFRNRIDEKLILETAEAMKASGLADAGYQYVNLDDCWQSSMRDENGRLQGDFANFPSGIPALVKSINELGLKLGIYSSNGSLTCEDLPASLGNEAIDADTFAEWGVEYFKYDFCHNVPIPMRAPYIEYICVSNADGSFETTIPADDAALFGDAKIMEDERLDSGRYISGLSAHRGSALFTVEVPEAGEYSLTLGIRKKSNSFKYLEVTVNGEDKYTTTVPPTKGFTADGRHQVKITLEAGSNTIELENPVASRQDSAAIQYAKMGRELMRATAEYADRNGTEERPIVYSICEWGRNLPWRWGAAAGNLWRTTPDIQANWKSVLGIYEVNVNLFKYSGKGNWNDPDMLEVGNGKLTYNQNVSHFSLWCMMNSPLILGNDLRTMSDKVKEIVTNTNLIAIDQDSLAKQAKRVKKGTVDVLAKPLADGSTALCFFNKSSHGASVKFNLNTLCKDEYVAMKQSSHYTLHNQWAYETLESDGTVKIALEKHQTKVYIVK